MAYTLTGGLDSKLVQASILGVIPIIILAVLETESEDELLEVGLCLTAASWSWDVVAAAKHALCHRVLVVGIELVPVGYQVFPWEVFLVDGLIVGMFWFDEACDICWWRRRLDRGLVLLPRLADGGVLLGHAVWGVSAWVVLM